MKTCFLSTKQQLSLSYSDKTAQTCIHVHAISNTRKHALHNMQITVAGRHLLKNAFD